jgi:hypothetical protein
MKETGVSMSTVVATVGAAAGVNTVNTFDARTEDEGLTETGTNGCLGEETVTHCQSNGKPRDQSTCKGWTWAKERVLPDISLLRTQMAYI